MGSINKIRAEIEEGSVVCLEDGRCGVVGEVYRQKDENGIYKVVGGAVDLVGGAEEDKICASVDDLYLLFTKPWQLYDSPLLTRMWLKEWMAENNFNKQKPELETEKDIKK